MVRANRVGTSESLRNQLIRGGCAVGVHFAVGQIPGSVRRESPYSGENRRSTASASAHPIERKCVVPLQLSVVYSGSGLGLNRRSENQRETQDQQNIQLPHSSSPCWPVVESKSIWLQSSDHDCSP